MYQSSPDKYAETFVEFSRCGSWLGYEANDLSNMVPRNMKQSDFIMGIAKMFNLYFEADKQDPRTIIIEPRDVYYEDGDVLNWENKLDYSKSIKINVLPHDQSKNFVFKYMDDAKDFNTEEFKNKTQNSLTFGSYKYTSNDEFVVDEQVIEVPFASSYLERVKGTEPKYATPVDHPVVITKIIDPKSQEPGYEGDPSDWKIEPRILYFGGLINLPGNQNRNYDLRLTGAENSPVGGIIANYYVYAGHYDRVVHPRIDINFYTDNHYLPTTYWRNWYTETLNGGNGTSTLSTQFISLANNVIVGQTITVAKFTNLYVPFGGTQTRYVKVYSNTNPQDYFIGEVVGPNSATNVSIRVTSKFGTATHGDWTIQLLDVDMDYNLFKVFYKNQMIELTDQTSRLVTAYFNLNPIDIANFRFNDVIYAHKEYWRVNKIVDFDTSSDIKQTTQVELVKIIRANTNRLIDYTQGGFFGINGGIPSGPVGGGVGIPSGGIGSAMIVNNSNSGQVDVITNQTGLQAIYQQNNNIFKNLDGTVNKGVANSTASINTGNADIKDSIKDLNAGISNALNRPIEQNNSITLTREVEGTQTLESNVNYVMFDNTVKTKLFHIELTDSPIDGFSVVFDGLKANDIAFIKIVNENASTNEIMVVNNENGVIAKYNASTDVWHLNKL